MDLYLKQLYSYEYDPSNNLIKTNKIYKEKLENLNLLKDSFYKRLNKEDRIKYDDIFTLHYELEDLESAYSFSEGFKIAYEISLEVFH